MIIINLLTPDPPVGHSQPDSAQVSTPKPVDPNRWNVRRWPAAGAVATVVTVLGIYMSAPVTPPAVWPDGKTALCRDGEYSSSLHRSGTCSNHDGVAFWRDPRHATVANANTGNAPLALAGLD